MLLQGLHEGLADLGVAVPFSMVKHSVNKRDQHGRVIRRKSNLQPHHTIQCLRYVKQDLQKPKAFWKQVPWTDEAEIELSGHNHQMCDWRKKKKLRSRWLLKSDNDP